MKGPSLAFYCLQVNLTFAKRNVGVRSSATDQAPLTQAWNSRMPRRLSDARTCQQANKQSLHEGFPAVLPLSGSSRKSKNLELERGQLPPPLTAKRNEKKKPESVSTHSGNTEGLAGNSWANQGDLPNIRQTSTCEGEGALPTPVHTAPWKAVLAPEGGGLGEMEDMTPA